MNKRKKYIVLFILYAVFLFNPVFLNREGFLYAFDLGYGKADAGQPGAYLRYGAGVRSLGMGMAYSAVVSDSSSIYWNAAGLMRSRKMDITSQHVNMFENTSFSFFSISTPLIDRFGKKTGAVFRPSSRLV